jgi:type IV secretion system protein VirD4
VAETIAATREGGLAEERGGDHQIWERLGAKLLAPALHAAAVAGGQMADVVCWVDTRDPDDEVAKLLDDLGEPGPMLAWQASRSHSPRTQDSIYTTAEDLLGIYADPRVAEVTSGHDLDFAWFLTGPHTLYLYAPAHEQKRLRPLFETVIAQLVQVAQETAATSPRGLLDPRLLLALDEAGNVAAWPTCPSWPPPGAGRASSCSASGMTRPSFATATAPAPRPSSTATGPRCSCPAWPTWAPWSWAPS